MHSFLKEYGVGIVTLVFMAILIAMASPFGIRIREYLLPQLEYASTIGSEEMAKATGGGTLDDDVAAMSSIYACLYTDGELVLSATPIDNTGRTDVDTDFGECELKDIDVNNPSSIPRSWWVTPSSFRKIKMVNIINQIKPVNCSGWFVMCENLTEIKNIENLDTSECTNMSGMFYNYTSLTTLDLSNFDTRNVTNMSYMFYDILVFNNPQFFVGYNLPNIIDSKDLIQYFTNENIFDMHNVKNTDNMFWWAM